MSDQGADFGLVGGAYEAPMLLQDAQRLINWFVEIDPTTNAKEPAALLGCPGLNPIISTVTGAVRGAWVLPGLTSCIFVVGASVYVSTVTAPATQTSIAQFSTTLVGTLLTNSGRVVIRDNGALFGGLGGYAVLVDGTYAYYYQVSGTSRTAVFTGNLTVGSPTITFNGSVPYTLIIASNGVLTDSAGQIPAGTNISSISYNSITVTMTANSLGNAPSDTITLTVPVFGQITDPAFLGASRVAFIEGWLIFNEPLTRTFYTNAPVAYTMTFAGAFYALKDSTSDNLSTLIENNRELWLIGDTHSEVWYNAGGANFAFARLPGVGPRVGCSASQSIAQVGSELCWLARIGEQGENVIARTNQYSWSRISTHAIEHAISQYPQVSDAIGDAYEEEGHLFYQITFPTADVTWVIDITTYDASGGKLGWFQRLSYDPVAGQYHRHRGNCFVNFADIRMCGDYTTGQIHQQSRSIYTDAGNPLRCQRRTPHVWSRENRKRVFQSAIQVEFTPGVGLNTGQGSNPQAMLRWSNDGGFTWSNEHWTTIGAIGATRNRAVWRRLGRARDRVYELNYSDPTARDIVGASLFGQPESSDEPEAA